MTDEASQVDRSKRTAALAEALLRHIPSLEAHDSRFEAGKLLLRVSNAEAFSRFDAADRRPKRDAAKLRDAAKAMNRAQKHLSEVGFAGCAEMRRIRNAQDEAESSLPTVASESAITQRTALADHLLELSSLMSEAAAELSKAEGPADREYRDSRPEKYVAYVVCKSCAEIYEAHIGEKPARRTFTGTSVSYGPFNDLVRDVFDTLNVDGDPDYFMRRVVG